MIAPCRDSAHDGQMAAPTTRTIDGHRIRLTSLDKVMYPSTGLTKAGVIDYVTQVAPHLLRHAQGRPATRKRWIDGVGTARKPGETFFHKNLDDDAPSWMTARSLRHRDHTNRYPLLDTLSSVVWFVQRGALEFHVPQWRYGARGKHLNPDRVVIDLDPDAGLDLSAVAEIAFAVREALAEEGVESVPVTSGSKGIHVYGALDQKRSSDEVTEWVRDIAGGLASANARTVTATMSNAARAGRVLIDWSQNRASKSTVAPYSLRGRLRPWVACPRTWDELGQSGLSQLEHHEVVDLLADRGDPLASITGDT